MAEFPWRNILRHKRYTTQSPSTTNARMSMLILISAPHSARSPKHRCLPSNQTRAALDDDPHSNLLSTTHASYLHRTLIRKRARTNWARSPALLKFIAISREREIRCKFGRRARQHRGAHHRANVICLCDRVIIKQTTKHIHTTRAAQRMSGWKSRTSWIILHNPHSGHWLGGVHRSCFFIITISINASGFAHNSSQLSVCARGRWEWARNTILLASLRWDDLFDFAPPFVPRGLLVKVVCRIYRAHRVNWYEISG